MKILILVLALLTTTSAISEEQIISVVGELQFWKRHCDSSLNCELPTPLSEKISIEGEVKRPDAANQLSQFHQDIDTEVFELVFDSYWKIAASPDDVGFIAHQHKLILKGETDKLICECSQYQAESTPSFPVGMCSGYIYEEDSITQYGVTFYKR